MSTSAELLMFDLLNHNKLVFWYVASVKQIQHGNWQNCYLYPGEALNCDSGNKLPDQKL